MKKVGEFPASSYTRQMAHAYCPITMVFCAVVTGLVIDGETVSSWAPVKKAASQRPLIWPPFSPLSKVQISKVPAMNTLLVKTSASTRRANRRR